MRMWRVGFCISRELDVKLLVINIGALFFLPVLIAEEELDLGFAR